MPITTDSPNAPAAAQATTINAKRKHTRARIGIFNVGFHRYWPQFPGLREELDRLPRRI